MRTTYDLMLAAARHLTGLPIELNFTSVRKIGALGATRKNHDGVMILDLADDYAASMSDQSLWVFIHELAHVKLHGAGMPASDTANISAREQLAQTKNSQSKLDVAWKEKQANDLAKTWLTWARRHAPKEQDNGASNFENYLTILLKYPKEV